MAVKDRVMETVTLAKTLPPAMSSQRLANVNLFMRSIGLDVELLAWEGAANVFDTFRFRIKFRISLRTITKVVRKALA